MTPEQRAKKAEYMKAYREKNRERLIAADRARYEANREAMNAQNKAYRQAHAAEIAKREKRNYEINREVKLERERARYEAKKERIKEVQRAYRASRPQAIFDRNARRRAVIAGVESAPYRPSEIFARDGWVCGLCAKQIDPDLRHPDPMSPSIDHIVPLAAGGSDVPVNLQAAHLVCNTRKGARVMEEAV